MGEEGLLGIMDTYLIGIFTVWMTGYELITLNKEKWDEFRYQSNLNEVL